MDIEMISMYKDEYKEKLEKAIDFLAESYIEIRAGRANPKILERISVDYYGTPTPLSQMATITAPEARMIVISLWDISMMKDVKKAIECSNLGINPSDDGRVIRLVFPMLTNEKRKEIAKDISKLAENTKVTCRNERRDILDIFKKMKKDSEVSEDEYSGMEKDVQNTLDSYIATIDKMEQAKSKEIMEL